MRRIVLLLLCGILIVPPVYAAPCYGTKMPLQNGFFAGGQTYMLLKRYLSHDAGRIRSTQHFLLVSYGVTDWFSIDLKGGAGNIKQHRPTGDEIDYPMNFAGGYGFRVRLYNDEKNKIVFGFQHISVHPHTAEVAEPNKAILDDWQFSLLGSHAFGRFTPYAGARWSRTDLIHRVFGNKKRYIGDLAKSVGAITGCDIGLTDKIWINVEGQFIDAKAAAVSLNFAF